MYMDDRMPYMAARCDLSLCGAKAASSLLESKFVRATDVKNEKCYIISRKPALAASVKGCTLWYYVFIQNEMKLFEKDNLMRVENLLTTANSEIGELISKACGEDDPKPRLSEFLVSLNISRAMP